MLRLLLIAFAALACCPAFALTARERAAINKELMELAPDTRAEQRCDGHALGAVGREHPDLTPDRTVAYAFGPPTVRDGVVDAPGAALRSNGEWYRLSFFCRTSPDGLEIEAFRYTLGIRVPRDQWSAHDLFQ